MRSQLADVHKTANTLSDELEKPEGSLRKWRPLPGTDPDQETLSSAASREHLAEGRWIVRSHVVQLVARAPRFRADHS